MLMSSDILSDYTDVAPFAADVGRHPRSILRWMNEPNGLPYLKLGNRRLIHVPTARQWLLGRIQQPNPSRLRVRIADRRSTAAVEQDEANSLARRARQR
jgi:hypothetical protein